MGNIGKATEPCILITNQQVTDIFLKVPWALTSEMTRIRNLYCFMYRQHIWLREKERWLFVEVVDHVGIYGSKVAEGLSAFNVGLVFYSATFTGKFKFSLKEVSHTYCHVFSWVMRETSKIKIILKCIKMTLTSSRNIWVQRLFWGWTVGNLPTIWEKITHWLMVGWEVLL